MKLLSAILLSLGLSFSVWADDEVKSELQLWADTAKGTFGSNCKEFIEHLKAYEQTSLDGRQVMSGHFASFFSGYNMALYFANIENGEVPGSEHVGDLAYFNLKSLPDSYFVVDAISLRCRSTPDKAVVWAVVEWMNEYQQSLK